ncbi:MAG TPA: DUF2188 domain-containing protein [Longimicrobium sp.]|jgi:hypothetical protein
MKKTQHVVPQNGGWAVRREGDSKASRVFEKQTDAISHARDEARKAGGELVIHGRDGRIREKNSYGRDSFPPKG